jgi:Short C-terminal domain
MKSIWKGLLGAFVLCSAGAVTAADGVFIDRVPSDLTSDNVLSIVRQAFIGRQWTVAAGDAQSVTATLKHDSYHATMTVTLIGDALLYKESVTRRIVVSGPGGGTVRRVAKTPQRWLAFLRSDIARSISLAPRRTSGPADNSADRIRALKRLLDDELITPAEYDRKKAEILQQM